MAWQLRAYVTLPDDLSFVPAPISCGSRPPITLVTANLFSLPSSGSTDTHVADVHTDMHTNIKSPLK